MPGDSCHVRREALHVLGQFHWYQDISMTCHIHKARLSKNHKTWAWAISSSHGMTVESGSRPALLGLLLTRLGETRVFASASDEVG